MGLSIGSATVGADSEGLEELYTKIHAECIEQARTIVNNTEAIKEAIKDCWNGKDEEKFEQNLDKFVQKVDKALEAYDTAIKDEFTAVFKEWINFQENHVKC